MTFPISHWEDPRKTIATALQWNDLAYATHGAQQMMVALRKLAHLPHASDTLLDYGCGTGRIGRCAAALFDTVWGYDPQEKCIAEGMREAEPLKTPNLVLTSKWEDVPEVDYAICVNVIEHLTEPMQAELIGRVREKVRAETVIWYRPATNGRLLAPFLSETAKHEDARNPQGIQVRALTFRA
jgi:2-polyprenyl-3-methyl-5-hydroxy-6-metoxy-1,4-benzoquinol methylase